MQLKEAVIFHKVRASTDLDLFGSNGPLSDILTTGVVDEGRNVCVVNPARIKSYAQRELVRKKTDKTDAATIVHFIHAVKPDRWQAPSPEVRQLRAFDDQLEV